MHRWPQKCIFVPTTVEISFKNKENPQLKIPHKTDPEKKIIFLEEKKKYYQKPTLDNFQKKYEQNSHLQ
jgi:hypothetical protein